MNYLDTNHKSAELRAAILTLTEIKRNIPKDIFCNFVELHLDEMVQWTNNFINNRENSVLKLSYIVKFLVLLEDIYPIEVADRYYNRIELIKLVRLFQYESTSFFTQFLKHLINYWSRPDHSDKQNVKNKINAIFNEIKLVSYTNEINNKLSLKLSQVSNPNYISKDNDAMTTTIARVAEPFIKGAALLDDEIEKQSVLSNVSLFYSDIDWKSVGNLIEAYKIGFGPICKLIEMFRKSKCNKFLLNAMLSEIDFVRIALNYNDKPINNAHLSVFCKVYLSKQSAALQWKSFFETIDFHFINDKGGFNFADTSFMLQLLTQIYHEDRTKLSQLLEQLDFSMTGIKARGKDEDKLNNLFVRLLKARLTAYQYEQFLEGFGSEECLRLSSNQYFNRMVQHCCLRTTNDTAART